MLWKALLHALALGVILLLAVACDEPATPPLDDVDDSSGGGYASFGAVRLADDVVPDEMRAGLAPFEGTADSTIVDT